jgi:TrmH family RNA methyltransferase
MNDEMNTEMNAASNESKSAASGRVHVVLNRPIYPRNVGMCARAVANMGLADLIIIGPRAELSHEEAKQGAANAQSVLASARIYPNLDSFFAKEGEGVRIALSGRDGRLICSSEFGHRANLLNTPEPLYLFFGPEDDGLSNEETHLCNHVCRLPTFGTISSLNLSHAVLLTLFMLQAERGTPTVSAAGSEAGDETTAPAQKSLRPLYYPRESIHEWLDALGFNLSARRVSIEKSINRIFLANVPKSDDLRLLDSVLQQTIRKLKERTSG